MGTGLAPALTGEVIDLGSVGWRSPGPEAKAGTAMNNAMNTKKEDLCI
jgi:hypothetical protein